MGIPIGGYGGGLPQNGTVASLTATDHLAAKVASPAIGGDGEARLYAVSVGGQERWAQIGGDAGAVPRRIGSSEACCLISSIYPGSGASLSAYGCAYTSVGTIGHQALVATNLVASNRRWRTTSAGTANSQSEVLASHTMCWRGNAAGLGGFTADFRFNAQATSANCRAFVGLTDTAGAALGTTCSPQAITNSVGMMYESGETTWRIGSNDTTGNATRVNLGASFPTTDTTALYSLSLNCEPNSSTIGYTVTRHDTVPPVTVSGTLSTDLPAGNAFLAPHMHINNGGDASVVALEGHFIVIEVPLVRV